MTKADCVVCYLVPDAWAYRVQIEVKKKSWKWFGYSFADVCVYSDIELIFPKISSQPGNFGGN